MYKNSLTGYKHSCGKILGGIKSIVLIERCRVSSFNLSSDGDSYDSVNIKDPEGFALFRFAEGGAKYNEICQREDGLVFVTHSIEFVMDKMDSGSRNVLNEILTASLCGLIAIVTTTQGSSLVVGYSEELGGERPLRLSRSEGSSGKEYTDNCGETVTLTSRDISKARLFTGAL